MSPDLFLTSRDVAAVVVSLVTAGLLGVGGLVWHAGARARAAATKQGEQLEEIITVMQGTDGSLIADTEPTPGLVRQVHSIQQTVTQVQKELGRIEDRQIRDAALAQRERARIETTLTDRDSYTEAKLLTLLDLLRQHMRIGKVLLDTGNANDQQLLEDLRAFGVPVRDLAELPDSTLVLPEDEQEGTP